MFTPYRKIPHSLESPAKQVEYLLQNGLISVKRQMNDFSEEQFTHHIQQKMQDFKFSTLAEIKSHPVYENISEFKSEIPLVIGSGPILDSYKNLHQHLKKADKEHLWPEAYYPELTDEKYSLLGNIAFVYAGIATHQTFELVTPLDFLIKRGANGFYISDIGGAFVEVVWLLKNNYFFEVTKNGTLLLKPKTRTSDDLTLPTMTQKYFHLGDAKKEMEKLASIWNQFSEEEVMLLKRRWATDFLATKAYANQHIKTKSEYMLHLAEAQSILIPKQNITFQNS